mmetsp:Transcript_60909/g.125505  ORF Transcript_60909/g.125505 Transcript_60909/m.125505 type:complete len:246 (-) Transcript_60909:494-1231(-)
MSPSSSSNKSRESSSTRASSSRVSSVLVLLSVSSLLTVSSLLLSATRLFGACSGSLTFSSGFGAFSSKSARDDPMAAAPAPNISAPTPSNAAPPRSVPRAGRSSSTSIGFSSLLRAAASRLQTSEPDSDPCCASCSVETIRRSIDLSNFPLLSAAGTAKCRHENNPSPSPTFMSLILPGLPVTGSRAHSAQPSTKEGLCRSPAYLSFGEINVPVGTITFPASSTLELVLTILLICPNCSCSIFAA